MIDREAMTPPASSTQTSAIAPELPAQPAGTTITPATKTSPCRYLNAWCIQGDTFHDPCATGWTKLTFGASHGNNRSESVLEFAIESHEGGEPALVLCPEGRDASEVSSDFLRHAAHTISDYVPLMLAAADRYDEILRARRQPADATATSTVAVLKSLVDVESDPSIRRELLNSIDTLVGGA
jgi:hypothetical protein